VWFSIVNIVHNTLKFNLSLQAGTTIECSVEYLFRINGLIQLYDKDEVNI